MRGARVVNHLIVGLIGALFLMGLFFSMVGGESPEMGNSVRSSLGDGRRALFLLLEELGFEPQAWRQAPISLPAGEHLLWMSNPPLRLDVVEDEEAAREVGTILEDPRHPAGYGEFVRGGGTLVIPGSEEGLLWLREECGLAVPDWEPCEWGSGSLMVELDSGEVLGLQLEEDGAQAQAFEGLADWDSEEHDLAGWHDLATGTDGHPFAAWVSLGHGRVVLLADDGFMGNETVGEANNGLFTVRLLEALERGGDLMFDEYSLGLWLPTSKVELLLLPGVFEITYHLLLALLVFVLLQAWVREFPRDPVHAALDPRLRVASHSRLLERAKRHDILGHELRLGGLRRIAMRAGLAPRAGALREDTSPEELEQYARQLGTAVHQKHFEVWNRVFRSDPVRGARELEELGRNLNDLEKSIARELRQTNTGRRSGA
jgi:hypothetical protein